MFLKKLIVGEFQANCYIVADENKNGIVVDPGGEAEEILATIARNKLRIFYIVATHAHIDHIACLEEVRKFTGARFLLHPDEISFLENPDLNLSSLLQNPRRFSPPDRLVRNKDKIIAGDIELEVIHTPGHTPGSICLRKDDIIFTGDTIFYRGVGRTDFPGGDFDLLRKSIKERIFSLPENTKIFPGHGPETEVGQEKMTNPFV